MLRNFKTACVALISLVISFSAFAATDGTVTLNVTLAQDGGNYKPRHVDAVWITTSAGTFIKSLRREGTGWTGTGTKHLYQWQTARGTSQVIDGYTGATTTAYGSFTVIWNCRDANNALVPDGDYKLWVEMTEANAQGYYTTNGLSWTKGTTASTNTYTSSPYISGLKITYAPSHNVAVLGISPGNVAPNINTNITVTITNKTLSPETFSVTLSNSSSGVLIGSQNVTALAGNAKVDLTFPWNTTGLLGSYTLQAVAAAVPGETSTSDNVLSSVVTVGTVPHDIAIRSITPTVVQQSSNISFTVSVTNKTPTTESFRVGLSNVTSSASIGSKEIASLSGNAVTNVTFAWSAPNVSTNYQFRATAGPVASETSTADNALTATIDIHNLLHNVAVLGITAPAVVAPNSTTTVTVLATNTGEAPEAFAVVLSDLTDARRLGSNQIIALAPATATNLSFSWTATNSFPGYHRLQAVSSSVATETALLDNTNEVLVPVATGTTTKTFVQNGESWQYNDLGLNFTAAPWYLPDYYDGTWPSGGAPLGYSEDGQHAAIQTILSWGPDASSKYPTYYFRKRFDADALSDSITLRVRSDDGVILFLNGREILRLNMGEGPVASTTFALQDVTGTNEYAYFSTNIAFPNIRLGENVLAAEVHQFSADSADMVFDLEMSAQVPLIPPLHQVDALSLTTQGDVVQGDAMSLTVSIANRGNATESALVIVKNMTTGEVVSSQTIDHLNPEELASVQLNWNTTGAPLGTNRFVAFAVVGGVTNIAGAITNSAVVSASGFSSSPGNVAASMGGRCAAVTSSGNKLLIGLGATLEVWDSSNPVSPGKLGAVRLPGNVEDIAFKGSYAFVACGAAGVQFVDLTIPEHPILRKTFRASGHAYQLTVEGNQLFVANGSAGLRILNISNPAEPALIGTFYTRGPARAIAASSGKGYVLDQNEGLVILDLSTPTAPVRIGIFSAVASGQAIAVEGSLACVVDGNNRLHVIDVSNPSSPTGTGMSILPNACGMDVALKGTTAYVAAGSSGLLVFDLSLPESPECTASIPLGGSASGLSLNGTMLYVAKGFSGIGILTVSDTPVLQTELSIASRPCDAVIRGDFAYVAAGESGLQIYALTNPAIPKLLGEFKGVNNARCVAVALPFAYVSDGQSGLNVVDVSDPSVPAFAGAYSSPSLGSIRNIGITGSQMILSDGRTLELLDISIPAVPMFRSSYRMPNFGFSMQVTNSVAYVACGDAGLITLSVLPGSLSTLGSFTGTGPAIDVAVQGSMAYVGYANARWRILDVSNPASPFSLKGTTSLMPVSAIAASGAIVILAGGTEAVAHDASVPLTPVQKGSFGPLMHAMRLAATPEFALALEQESGLSVLSTTGDLDRDGLADSWEQQIIGASITANGAIRSVFDVRAQDDFDNDGASNGAEYLAGTSPTDDSSVFMLSAVQTASGVATVTWHSVAGKTYTVYKSTDLSAGFSIVLDNIQGTPPLNTYTDNSGTAGQSFYVVGVR